MKKIFTVSGFTTCFTALLVMLGGDWFVLQSVAWTRMLATFLQQESLGMAFVKTFDGKHPCPMCLQIRAGREQENRQQETPTLVRSIKIFDLFLADRQPSIPSAPVSSTDAMPGFSRLHSDFVESPPTPPPRPSSLAA